MEFRDAVVQNEIDHLGKNFRLLSAELLLLQDFVKQEFGSKFSEYCNTRRQQQQPSFSIPAVNNPSSRQAKVQPTTQKERKQSFRHIMEMEQEQAEIFGMEQEEPCIIPDGLNVTDSDADDSDIQEYFPVASEGEYSDGDMETFETKHTPNLNLRTKSTANENEGPKKGRPKSVIHKYFEKIQTDDGKWRDRCYTCGNFVSSKAPRLKNHLLKCRGKDSKVINVIKKLAAGKCPTTTENSKVMEVLSKLDASKFSPSLNSNRLGRKMDIVRIAFNEIKDSSGYNKMKCLNCGELVSNKPLRMRNHLTRCSGGASDFDSEIPAFETRIDDETLNHHSDKSDCEASIQETLTSSSSGPFIGLV